MELAMAPRVLPSLPQSRLLIPKPLLTSSLRFRAKPGLVRSSSGSSSGSGSDFWSRVAAREEAARTAVAEKEDEAPTVKEEEAKEEVSSVEETKEKEEVSSVEETKVEVSSVQEAKEEVSVVTEVKEEVTSSEELSPASDILKQLNIELDSEDKSKLLVYGAGALASLWILSVVVSAVESIPLFPKLMEVVGLGYSVWFSSRYLLFKENREELFGKIIELKNQVLGSEDE